MMHSDGNVQYNKYYLIQALMYSSIIRHIKISYKYILSIT